MGSSGCGLVLGVTTGLAAAMFCLATRSIETLALIFYSVPVYLSATAPSRWR